ncbi:MAG: hypothetical protein IAF94_24115 [Pirellulaceae bacterium]|nr:hypothetical protein [Pirellulaceae bacterium]
MLSRQSLVKLLLLANVPLLSGCLSLFDSTTNVQNNPQVHGRIAALEQRVSSLEQVLQDSLPEPIPSALPQP